MRAFLHLLLIIRKSYGKRLENLLKEERLRGGIYGIDESKISTITSHEPGYID